MRRSAGRRGARARYRRRGASARWGTREQRPDAELQMRHDRHARRRPGRDGRVIHELYELRARRHVRAEPFHVIRERGRAEHQNEIRTGEARHDACAIGCEEAGE